MRLVDDKKLTELLDKIYNDVCPWCPIVKNCKMVNKYADVSSAGRTKRACFSELRKWLTPEDK